MPRECHYLLNYFPRIYIRGVAPFCFVGMTSHFPPTSFGLVFDLAFW